MNMSRVALAAVAAWVVDAVYGFCVYGNLLQSEFARYPNMFRPMETQVAYMPFLFGGILLAMFAAAYMYAKGYEGGSGAMEGARFGALIGLVMVGYVALVNYAIFSMGRRLAGSMALSFLVEWIIAGIVIGIVYKPIAVSRTSRA
jgi:hypothetical protein